MEGKGKYSLLLWSDIISWSCWIRRFLPLKNFYVF